MNPNNKTWQEDAREYIELAKNPLSNQRNLEVIKKRFDYINIANLSNEDKDLLSKIYEW